MKRSITILYDRIEDDAFERALADGVDATQQVPVHVALGEALGARGYSVKKLPATRDVPKLLGDLVADDSDVIFNICDGIDGDMKCAAHVVSLLELLRKPFTGSTSSAMRVASDKPLTKQIFLAHGIATPRYAVIAPGDLRRARRVGVPPEFPLIVKPVDLDASEGITERSIVHDVDELLERVAVVHTDFGSPALVEEFIAGREIYATILGNERPDVLPLLEWPLRSDDSICSWEAKWSETHEDYQRSAGVFPHDLAPGLVERIRRDATVAYKALELSGYARFDIRLGACGTPYVLEANPNPYFDVTAEVAVAALAAGLDYGSLAERIIEYGLSRRVPARRRASRRRTAPVKTGTARRKRAG